jgi:hypothetical protein
MTRESAALRRALTAHDRALLKRLGDAEIRRRQKCDEEQTAAIKRRYVEQLAVRKRPTWPRNASSAATAASRAFRRLSFGG